VAGLDLAEAGEPVGNVALVVVVERRDRDEGREREAERLGIDEGPLALDDAVGFEPPHARACTAETDSPSRPRVA
jgi:hypothetical protein